MTDSPVDPTIVPEKVPDPDGHDDGDHPSNPDKTGESIDGRPGPADDPQGERVAQDPVG